MTELYETFENQPTVKCTLSLPCDVILHSFDEIFLSGTVVGNVASLHGWFASVALEIHHNLV